MAADDLFEIAREISVERHGRAVGFRQVMFIAGAPVHRPVELTDVIIPERLSTTMVGSMGMSAKKALV